MSGKTGLALTADVCTERRRLSILRAVQDTPLGSGEETLEFRLLNEFQRDFPFVPRPFEIIAEDLGVSETSVIERLRRLQALGCIGRVGAVFAPRRIGVSTLAALAAQPEWLESIAARVGAHPEVNHNYERAHGYNLWFVVTAADAGHLGRVLGEIEAETGCAVISLPLVEEFHIDLGFDLNGGPKRFSDARRVDVSPSPILSALERRVTSALETGLEIVPKPFEALARRAESSEDQVLALLKHWRAGRVLKRFGVVVRHRELGFRANAMVVWDIPDERINELGMRLAREPGVTLCYRRERQLPRWRYNLYCMIHGAEPTQVESHIDSLHGRLKLGAYPRAVLFSTRRFKQCGARYAAVTEHSGG